MVCGAQPAPICLLFRVAGNAGDRSNDVVLASFGGLLVARHQGSVRRRIHHARLNPAAPAADPRVHSNVHG